MDDLLKPLMLDYLREVGSALADDAESLSVEALGRQMNVGLLFFNEAPDRFFPYSQIDVVWFPEGAGGDRFDEKIFKGPLARMTREALGYIQRNYTQHGHGLRLYTMKNMKFMNDCILHPCKSQLRETGQEAGASKTTFPNRRDCESII